MTTYSSSDEIICTIDFKPCRPAIKKVAYLVIRMMFRYAMVPNKVLLNTNINNRT